MKELAAGIYIIEGSVNGGALIHGRHALLIDMPETVHPQGVPGEIRSAGADIIDMVLLTQGRRSFCGGLFQYDGSALVAASLEEAEVLRTAGDVWRKEEGLFHRYELFPDHLLPFTDCIVDCVLQDGDVREWNGFSISCIVVGAQSAGDMIYVVTDKETGMRYAFCGSFAMAGGRIAELYSLQKALPGMMGYHGHMAGLIQWKAAAKRLRLLRPDVLIPAYGPVEADPIRCIDLLEERLTAYAENYVEAGAVRYYFPEEFRKGFEIPMGIYKAPKRAEIKQHPEWLGRIGETTSYLIRSESNHAILIDAGDREAVDYVKKLADEEGRVLDALWVTHYHDDHLNAVKEFLRIFGDAQREAAEKAEADTCNNADSCAERNAGDYAEHNADDYAEHNADDYAEHNADDNADDRAEHNADDRAECNADNHAERNADDHAECNADNHAERNADIHAGMRTHNSSYTIMTTMSVAQVIMDPHGYHLPAICDISVQPWIMQDGETWQWQGFTLTAVHFPAQSLHHAGLLVEKDGDRVLMCGDGFAPTGFDDYCPYNRNLPGEGRGYRLCLDFLKDKEGINLVNEHQSEPFAYDGEYLKFLSDNLAKRDELLAQLLPAEAGLGLDPYWVRIYPASQRAKAGGIVKLAVQVTGHGEHEVEVRLRVPWELKCEKGLPQDQRMEAVRIKTTGITSGSTLVESKDVPRDYAAEIGLYVPEHVHGECFIPADCFIDGHYIGSLTYAEIIVD